MTAPVPKVGLVLPMFSGSAVRVLSAAREAEALGFDGVFGFDHLFPMGGPVTGPAFECFSTLSAVGAVTSRVAVGTLVARVGLRSAGMLAKLAAGLDHVTGGRAILGLGTGDRLSDDEHRVYGFPIERPAARVERLRETVAALRALFDGQPYPGGHILPSMAGPVAPGPVRAGGPPIWIGGTSDAVVSAAAVAADAWNGWDLSARAFEQKVNLLYDRADGRPVEATWGGIVLIGDGEAEAERLGAERAARGRAPAAFTGSAERFVDHLADLAAGGATWMALLAAGPADRAALIAERVLPAIRG